MTTQEELAVIAKKHRGNLRPHDVVAYARDPKTSLHSQFQWDDSVAAEQYRLWQARQIIRVSVIVVPHGDKEMRVRAYWSLPSQRNRRGGYRGAIEVMDDEDMREELLAMARDDMTRFRVKYQSIVALSKVIDAMNETEIELLAREQAKRPA